MHVYTSFKKLVLSIFFLHTCSATGYYIQPDILFLTEHPESQYVVVNSSLTLNCGVQLRGLDLTEGGLNVPIVWWTFNNTRIFSVRFVLIHYKNTCQYYQVFII